MPNMNKTFHMGNLTRDVELRYTPNNTAVATFGMAINREWFNKQTNEKEKEVTFIDFEAWGRTAEVLNQYVKKGDPLFVEGRLKLDQWEDKDGVKRSKLKVVVENMQFLGSKRERPSGTEHGSYQNQGPHRPVDDDDIPF